MDLPARFEVCGTCDGLGKHVNPNIDREAYVKQLKESGVDPLTLAQMLEGDWDAVAGTADAADRPRVLLKAAKAALRLRDPDGAAKRIDAIAMATEVGISQPSTRTAHR